MAAAAQTYFNKSLSELEPHEAAMLAAMPQAPGRYHPVRAKERVTERRNYVLREMWQNGFIDEATYEAEAKLPLRSVQNGDFPSAHSQMPPRDYFTDEIRRQLSREFGEDEFFGGGLTIRATVDPELQSAAADALREALEQYDRGRGVWRGTGEELPPRRWRPRPLGVGPCGKPACRATFPAGIRRWFWRWMVAAPVSGSRASKRMATATGSRPRTCNGRAGWTARPGVCATARGWRAIWSISAKWLWCAP